MNKKSILIIIAILVISAILYSALTSSNEIIVNNVAGVDNVRLDANMFGPAFKVKGEDDGFHLDSGSFIVQNKMTSDRIVFFVEDAEYLKKFHHDLHILERWQNYDSNKREISNLTVSGINGHLIVSKTSESVEYYTFSINDKTYVMYVTFTSDSKSKVDSINSNLDAITALLDAWLKASDYKQT